MGGCHEILFNEPALPTDTTVDEIAAALDQLARSRGFPSAQPRNESWFAEHCLAENLTRRQCALFEQCLTDGSSRVVS
jgi:hypothetical protein